MLALASAILLAAQTPPKNVILIIGDGAGYAQFEAAAMADGKLGRETFRAPGWLQIATSTHPLRMEKAPGNTDQQDPNLVYDPAKAWNPNDGYKWLKETPTDSAAAATAYATGKRVYKHSLCWSDLQQPIPNVNDLARKAGKSLGVVTSVEWSDATPAAMIAHNRNRDNRVEVAREMVEQSGATVIMGACHPWYDGHGRRLEKMGDATWVGEQPYITTPMDTWRDIRFIETKADFEALAKGRLDMKGAKRVVGTARIAAGLQIERDSKDWNRDGKVDNEDRKVAPLNGDPAVKTVPDLPTMTRGALHLLKQNPKGFFLMVEGGAIDHAGHYNWPARMVEEGQALLRTIEAVDAWVKRNGGYEQTLVVITADHETGCVYGPDSDRIPFQPMVDLGRGKVPGLKFNSLGHTNVLVPLYARGPGVEILRSRATGRDPKRGAYLNNTDVFHAFGL